MLSSFRNHRKALIVAPVLVAATLLASGCAVTTHETLARTAASQHDTHNVRQLHTTYTEVRHQFSV